MGSDISARCRYVPRAENERYDAVFRAGDRQAELSQQQNELETAIVDDKNT
jgi:hypothetical protein